MDGSQFDSLLRTLTAARSRRGALLGLLGGALGPLGLTDTSARHHKKKKKKKSPPAVPPPPQCPASCPACQTCTNGQSCTPAANDTTCDSDGRCLNGTCNPLPTCAGSGEPCDFTTQFPVCCGSN